MGRALRMTPVVDAEVDGIKSGGKEKRKRKGVYRKKGFEEQLK